MILEYKIIYSEFSSFSVIALMIDFVVYMSDQQEQPQPIQSPLNSIFWLFSEPTYTLPV